MGKNVDLGRFIITTSEHILSGCDIIPFNGLLSVHPEEATMNFHFVLSLRALPRFVCVRSFSGQSEVLLMALEVSAPQEENHFAGEGGEREEKWAITPPIPQATKRDFKDFSFAHIQNVE